MVAIFRTIASLDHICKAQQTCETDIGNKHVKQTQETDM